LSAGLSSRQTEGVSALLLLFEFSYLTYLHFFHFCFYFYPHFLTDFGELFFYFSLFSAILIVGSVVFPSPLMMIITYYLPVHIRLFFLFFFSFFFAVWWYQTMCSIKIFLEKQASRQQFEITACSLDFLLGWYVSLSF